MHPYFRQGVFNRVVSKTMNIFQCQVISLRTDGDAPDAFKKGGLIMYKKMELY